MKKGSAGGIGLGLFSAVCGSNQCGFEISVLLRL